MNYLPFKCNLCNYVSSTRRGVVKHVNEEHAVDCPENFITNTSNIKEYANMPVRCGGIWMTNENHCGYCGFPCVDKRYELQHILENHNLDDYYNCYECKYSTSEQSKFKRHMLCCFKIKEYKCYLCDYSAVLKETLKKHLKSSHGIEYSDISSEIKAKIDSDAIF